MTPEELKAFQEALIKELGAVMDEKAKTAIEAKIKELVESGQKDAEAIKEELKTLKAAIREVKAEPSKEYKSIVADIFREVKKKGVNSDEGFKAVADEILTKALNETTESAGGFAVFDQFERDIIREIESNFPVIGAIKWYNITKGDIVHFPVVDNGITTAWVAEGESDDPSQPTFGRVSINVYKMYSLINLTEELIDDYMASPDLYDLILELATESQGNFLTAEILNGTGTGDSKVVGMRNLVGVNTFAIESSTLSGITYDDVLDIEEKLPNKFAKNAKDVAWIITRYAYFQLRKVRENGNLMFPELKDGKLDLYNIIIDDNAGDVISKATDIAGAEWGVLANVKKYYGVRRKNFTAEYGQYGDGFKNGIKSIRITQRGGMKAARNTAFVVCSNGEES